MAPLANVSDLQPNDDLLALNQLSSKSAVTTEILEIPSKVPRSNTLVLNPTFITQDFDLLRFSAAAYNQLPSPDSNSSTPSSSSSDPEPSPAYSTYLISSPYNNPDHYLDLTSLPTPSALFAQALTALQPTRPDYATAPYTDSLNFTHILSVLRDLVRAEASRGGFAWPETSFYVVVFRSQLKQGVDQEWLYKLDYESHREACESGGLLKYWFGKADLQGVGERRNLATCFWHSRDDAYQGGLGPWHAKARRARGELYESIVFSTHRFTVLEGAEGYRFEDWKE